MSENLISIIDVAVQTGKRKATIFKILKRLNIEPIKRRSSANRGQVISYITNEELRQVLEQINLKEDFDIDVVESNLGPEALLFE